jgi:putative DNA primase/helicase
MIAARFMRQDFFEYRPQFKLTIIGNNKPVLQNVDDASRRRINMLPFIHRPPEPDRGLEEKLRAEWPAILRWMIDGCLDWQMNGLARPQVVIEATAEYFLEQDSFRQWVEDCCEVTTKPPHVMDTNESLFSSWQAFASARGEKAGSSKRFAANLKKLYCVPIRNEFGLKGRGWRGIKVRMIQPDPSEELYR